MAGERTQQLPRGGPFSRRRWLSAAAGVAGGAGLTPVDWFRLQSLAATGRQGGPRAKSCIFVYCWGGISHLESFDLKPAAPVEVRGEFKPISTVVPGIEISEHLPLLARHVDKLAIVRSIHHDDPAHGRGMYWNLTGHRPPRAGNIPPEREDWPSMAAVISKLHPAVPGVPSAVRLPYPMVDNNTFQAGEYGGFLGGRFDPILMRPKEGEPFGGVSRTLGSEPLNLDDVDRERLTARSSLLESITGPVGDPQVVAGYEHYRNLAQEMLLGSKVKEACRLESEDPRVRESYGTHLGGQSLLLARRLTEAGVPAVQVCCAAGDLNGGQGDMWDTHGDNFNRLKGKLLPVLDRSLSALLNDLAERGTLDDTLVALLTDFGRTPRVNKNAGRDHYPHVYSIALAGGGIRGGQVYGSSDSGGAFPRTLPCTPADVHATIFHALGISPETQLHDMLGRPLPLSDGSVLPLF